MSIHAALAHRTHYTYDRAVVHGPHVVRLRPAPHCKTKVLSYSLKVSGGEVFINWQQDPFSNWNARLVFPEPIRELLIEVELVVEMAVHNPFDFFLDDHAKHVPFTYEASQARELTSFFEV
ncbi:MAG: transglutaminase N-terminal domain-containing protein, partial [Verrucomicrobiota bacterium]